MSEQTMNDHETDETTSSLPARTRARQAAVQYLYARDLRPDEELNPEEYMDANEFSPELRRFGTALIEAVREHPGEIDRRIQEHSDNWQLDRMSVVDRNLLRLGIAEICFWDTPRTVVINECVELARRLGSQDSHEFVNAILDRIDSSRSESD